jgi:ribosomal protein S18 acetylase RimI-like enzyme
MASPSQLAAPIAMTMETRIEALSPSTLRGANVQANEFLGTRKAMFGIFSYRCCPTSDAEFSSLFEKNPGNYETSAVAVQRSVSSSEHGKDTADKKVVGFLQMSLYGQPREQISSLLHTLRPGEAYIEQLSVNSDMQGQGIGTRMLQWSEDTARAKGATVLSLGVVAGNPAIRLYQRFGFEEVHEGDGSGGICTSIVICCLLGCPYGRCGGTAMEKPLT